MKTTQLARANVTELRKRISKAKRRINYLDKQLKDFQIITT